MFVACVLLLSACGGGPERTASPSEGSNDGLEPFLTESAGPVSDDRREVAEAFRLLNEQRVRTGGAPLAWDGAAADAARAHGADMARRSYFDHESPEGGTVMHRVSAAGARGYQAVAENIAMGQRSGAAVVASWMNSPGHRDNILKAHFAGAGLSLTRSPAGPIWVLVFLTR